MEFSDEDQDLARSVADSLKRQVRTMQIAEIRKQIMEQKRKNRQKDLEIGRKNDQKKAIWVLQTLKLQKKLHETNDLCETAKAQWKIEKLKLKNALLQVEQTQTEETRFKLSQAERSLDLLLNMNEHVGNENGSPRRMLHSVFEEEATGIPPEFQNSDLGGAATPKKEDSSHFVITDQMRNIMKSRLNDWNSCEVKRKLIEIARTLHAFVKTLRSRVKPSKQEPFEFGSPVEEESSSSAPNSERSCEESPLKLINTERPRRAKWYERLCKCLS